MSAASRSLDNSMSLGDGGAIEMAPVMPYTPPLAAAARLRPPEAPLAVPVLRTVLAAPPPPAPVAWCIAVLRVVPGARWRLLIQLRT